MKKNNIEIKEEFNDIEVFTKCKFDGVLDLNRTHVQINNSFNYDIINWLNQEHRTRPLKEFKNKERVRMRFTYNANQILERNTLFSEFKENDAFSATNILDRIRPQHKLYRKFELIEDKIAV